MAVSAAEEVAEAVAVLEGVRLEWLERPGVNWLDVGPELRDGSPTGRVAVRVFVDRKQPASQLGWAGTTAPGDGEVLPDTLDGIPVDVLEASQDEAVRRSEADAAELPALGAWWAQRGHLLVAVGRAEEAEEPYARALELEPDDPGAWFGLGLSRMSLGRLEEATDGLRRAIELGLDTADVWASLGVVLVELGRLDEARDAYERLRELDPMEEQLADLEQRLATASASASARRPPTVDHVYTLSDAPDPVDRLGRKPLAESLAIRLRTLRDQDPATSFLLHIDGPWGAGKSSLLNYLRDDLTEESLVVDFNAWREQRVGPPWLGLLMALRRAAYDRYGWSVGGPELRSQLRAVGPFYIAVILIAAGITTALLTWAAAGDFDVTTLGDAAKSIAAVLALGATVWTATAGLSRRLLPGSPRQAQQFVESHADPMQKVADHFDELLGLVKDPVVFFIDDLDRCTEGYVVEFLEAVQTLLRDAPATGALHARDGGRVQPAPYLVVAADGRWIRASYEHAYASFAAEVAYPGRPLGYLFLEKAFQLTTNLPAIDLARRQEYMNYLLRIGDSGDPLRAQKADIQRAEDVLRETHTEAEILDEIERHQDSSPAFRFALLGQAVKQMAQPDVAERLEHALSAFAELLDPNPRAMKRFVNAYGVERALRTIEQRHPSLEQLARWTIVLLRWPELAALLRAQPGAVDLIGNSVRGEVSEDVKRLFTDPDVIRVLHGNAHRHGPPLDAAAIRDCAGLPRV
jgi:tetratricopeptide (TPR) repeat protein